MAISIYKFSKDTGIPRSTVNDKVRQLGWATDKGLSDSQVAELQVIFADRLPQDEQNDTPTEPITGTPQITAGLQVIQSDMSVLETYTPVEVIEPLQFTIQDNSQQRSIISQQISQQLQQTEANRQAIEQAAIRQAEERGAERALRAYQAEQAAYTQVSQQLQVSGAEVLGLIKKQSLEQ